MSGCPFLQAKVAVSLGGLLTFPFKICLQLCLQLSLFAELVIMTSSRPIIKCSKVIGEPHTEIIRRGTAIKNECVPQLTPVRAMMSYRADVCASKNEHHLFQVLYISDFFPSQFIVVPPIHGKTFPPLPSRLCRRSSGFFTLPCGISSVLNERKRHIYRTIRK